MGMVFLPGMAGLGSFWDPVREHLAQYDTAALDWPWEEVHDYDGFVEYVIDQLNEPTVLVGQSMGGYVAARVTLAAPELVSHLVLAVTSAGVDMGTFGATDWRPQARAANFPEWVFESPPHLDDRIGSIDVPTLLLWADADPLSPLGVGRRLHELLPNSELVTYASDDHRVVTLHPADVAARIARLVHDGAARELPDAAS